MSLSEASNVAMKEEINPYLGTAIYPVIGHLRMDIHMLKREDEDEDDGGYGEADGEEDEYDDYEDESTYVIRRLMLAPKKEDETQRYQNFRTRCTVKNHILDAIIDGGSYEKMIN